MSGMSSIGLTSAMPAMMESLQKADLSKPEEFSKVMTAMMTMMSQSSSMSGGSSDSSGMGMGMNMEMMMFPLMMQLIEKIGALQVEKVEKHSSSSGVRSASPSTVSHAKPSGRPVEGPLSQGYTATHHGLDFGIYSGTPVKTTMDGKVVYAGWNTEGYGNLVIVENGPYRTYYGHLSSIPVSMNQSVSKGTVIGISGNTGNSTGPHLHYEIRQNGATIDPTGITLGG
jgi:murein DD-endopeptidase MepM/ murein hydrolase activator NlpD